MEIDHLVIRPEPHPDEALRGYLARLCEENILSSPCRMLRKTGISEGETRNADQRVDVLTCLTGHSAEMLGSITYRNPTTQQSQLLGQPLARTYLRLKTPQICPDCIQEKQYIPALWDMLAVTHCQIHHRPLITHCPECNNPISWQRPKLLECKCGGQLVSTFQGPVHRGVIELTKVISSVLSKHRLQDSESELGIPFNALTNMSLTTLTGVIHTLGAMKLHLDGKSAKAKGGTDPAEITAAVDVFSHWPSGYCSLLSRYGDQYGKESIALKKQFSGVLGRIFKMGYPKEETEFLNKAFLEFGQSHWSKAHISSAMLMKSGIEDHRSRMTISEYAEAIGVSSSKVKNMLKRNDLKVSKVIQGGKEQTLVELESVQLLPDTGRSRSLKEAAKVLELPVTVLAELRRIGTFKVRHIAIPHYAYAKQDIEDFADELFDAAFYKKDLNWPLIKNLYQVTEMKIKDTVKAIIITKMINNEIMSYGPAYSIGAINLLKTDIDSVIASNMEAEHGFCLVKVAAQILGVSLETVRGLYDSGLVMGHQAEFALMIKKSTVEMFRERYIPLSEIARRLKTNTVKLLARCDAHHIEALQIPSAKSIQPFILREDVNLILN